jgi:large subunit ribosomal protein L5
MVEKQGPQQQPSRGRQGQQQGRGARQTAEARREDHGEEAAPQPTGPVEPPRLYVRYRQEIVPALMRDLGYQNIMQVPQVKKVVLNIGLGEALTNARAMEAATGDLISIAGQRPVTTRARKSIAGFKLREGMAIGLSVTLRGYRMWEFLDRLINTALPRIRDFRGVSRTSFDGRGNYSLGLREQVIFPEIDYNSVDRLRGLQVSIVTTARTDQESLRLLEQLGMPFARAQ